MGPLHAQPELSHGRTFPMKGKTLPIIDFPLLAGPGKPCLMLPTPSPPPHSHKKIRLGSMWPPAPLHTPSLPEIIQTVAFSWSPEHVRQDVLPTPSHTINCPWSQVKGGNRDRYRGKGEGEAPQPAVCW